MSQEAA